jgi:hypothetical protein
MKSALSQLKASLFESVSKELVPQGFKLRASKERLSQAWRSELKGLRKSFTGLRASSRSTTVPQWHCDSWSLCRPPPGGKHPRLQFFPRFGFRPGPCYGAMPPHFPRGWAALLRALGLTAGNRRRTERRSIPKNASQESGVVPLLHRHHCRPPGGSPRYRKASLVLYRGHDPRQ